MIDWLKSAWSDLIDWLLAIMQAVFDFLGDLLIIVLDLFLSAIATLLEQVVAPTFIANGIQVLFNDLDPAVVYFLSVSGFATGLSLIGAGYAFRLTRKLVTLFQW